MHSYMQYNNTINIEIGSYFVLDTIHRVCSIIFIYCVNLRTIIELGHRLIPDSLGCILKVSIQIVDLQFWTFLTISHLHCAQQHNTRIYIHFESIRMRVLGFLCKIGSPTHVISVGRVVDIERYLLIGSDETGIHSAGPMIQKHLLDGFAAVELL